MKEKNQKETNKNKAIEHWENKMKSKFDVDLNANLEVEEDEEDKEQAMKCVVCNDMFLVNKDKQCVIEGNFVCHNCVGKIVKDFVVDKLKEDL